MKNSKKNKPSRPTAVVKTVKTVKPSAPLGGRKTAQAPAREVKRIVAPSPGPVDVLAALTAEVGAVKARLLKEQESAPLGSDEEYDALRRLVNDLLERRMERVIRELMEIRGAAAALAGGAAVTEALESLLERLGAVRFDGQRLDHVDPLIHAVSRETHNPDLADGVITAALGCGFRTARGVILAKAQVAVNRRT
jgi:molecular chaperone GrpE (heat shock protein)